jgi:hypothetical protein
VIDFRSSAAHIVPNFGIGEPKDIGNDLDGIIQFLINSAVSNLEVYETPYGAVVTGDWFAIWLGHIQTPQKARKPSDQRTAITVPPAPRAAGITVLNKTGIKARKIVFCI